MRFDQGQIANKVLQKCLVKDRLQIKFYDYIWPNADCKENFTIILDYKQFARQLKDNYAIIFNQEINT